MTAPDSAPLERTDDLPPPASLPALSMSAAQSLPPEIYLEILRLAGRYTSRYTMFRTRYASLRGAALVCRSWTRIAQQVLWKDVWILSERNLWAFVASTAAGVGGRTIALDLTGLAVWSWTCAGFPGYPSLHGAFEAHAGKPSGPPSLSALPSCAGR